MCAKGEKGNFLSATKTTGLNFIQSVDDQEGLIALRVGSSYPIKCFTVLAGDETLAWDAAMHITVKTLIYI